MRNSYSPEFKAKLVREVLREARTLSQVATAHGVHPTQVSQWRDQALKRDGGVVQPRKRERLGGEGSGT